MRMANEAVFYGDVLGFKARIKARDGGELDALSDLALMLSDPLSKQTGQDRWQHRYALSDSVFLTHEDPAAALRAGADLMFNLAYYNKDEEAATLIRAGMAFGPVQHVKGIFLDTGQEPANLVGEGVLQAIELAEETGMKGPRVLLAESIVEEVRKRDASLIERIVIPTEIAGVWEMAWLLPANVEELNGLQLRNIGEMAMRFLRRWGGHPKIGAHYREFMMLVLRSVAKMKRWSREERQRLGDTSIVDKRALLDALALTTGLPGDFKVQVGSILEQIE